MRKFYATLPSGQSVTIPEDTLSDFYVLHRGITVRNTPDIAPLAKRLDAGVLKTSSYGVPVRVRRGAP